VILPFAVIKSALLLFAGVEVPTRFGEAEVQPAALVAVPSQADQALKRT